MQRRVYPSAFYFDNSNVKELFPPKLQSVVLGLLVQNHGDKVKILLDFPSLSVYIIISSINL